MGRYIPKFCGYCGSLLTGGRRFCPVCGKKVLEEPLMDRIEAYSSESSKYLGSTLSKRSETRITKDLSGNKWWTNSDNLHSGPIYKPVKPHGLRFLYIPVAGIMVAAAVLLSVGGGSIKSGWNRVVEAISAGNSASALTETLSEAASAGDIRNTGNMFDYLVIPDNYHCDIIISLNDTQIADSEYWYKDGRGKLMASLMDSMLTSYGVDLSDFNLGIADSISFINNASGTMYCCYPSMQVSVKMDIPSSGFCDQSSLENLAGSSMEFVGTEAATMDGLQCTGYIFEGSGSTVEYYVRNSLNIVIRCIATIDGITTDIYFKNMDLGSVTDGDVLMTNEYYNYTTFSDMTEFYMYIMEQAGIGIS